MMVGLDHVAAVLAAVEAAGREGLKVRPKEGVLSGFSGEKLVGLLQRLVSLPTARSGVYMEVGVFQGMTLLSTALANPKAVCYGIDNFSQFDKENKNFNLVKSRAKALSVENYKIINEDFEVALSGLSERIPEKVSTYFVDGPHDYRSQLICLGFSVPYLAPGAVVVVDDCNYPHVRQATYDFLVMRPDFKLIFEGYTPKHPVNSNDQEIATARRGWWDGVHVLVHDPDDLIEGLMPPVPADKSQFVDDHEVHSLAYGPLAVEALGLLYSFTRPWVLPRAAARVAKNYMKKKKRMSGNYRIANTYSNGLAPARLAKLKSGVSAIERERVPR